MNRALEREPGEKEFEPTPADGSTVSVNPPPIRWLAHDGVARWLVEMSGPGGQRLRFGPVRDPILVLPKKLAPGSWSWQFIGLDASGGEVGRSRERAFTVQRGLRGFVVPDVRRLARRWRNLRPRIFGQRIAIAREHLGGEFAAPFAQLQKWCSLAEAEPPMPDPAGYGPHPPDSEEHNRDWTRILSDGRIASAHAVRFALSYLLSGNTGHLDLAKRWALNCLAWNPWGTTSLATCDEAGMPLLERLAYVYDWLHPHWSAAERERFHEVMLIRGEEARERDRQTGFAARPFYNHQCRTLAFTGAAAIAFLGEIPQAAEWLRYVLQVLAVSYPSGSWGADDGGWSQGPSYWAGYMGYLVAFVAAAKELGIDLLAAPYYRNTGYFAVYNLPVGVSRGGFGDGADAAAGVLHKFVVGALGAAARDRYLGAYADAIPRTFREPSELLADKSIFNPCLRWDAWWMPEVMWIVAGPEPGRDRADLRRLKPARFFPYIGWAAMHSAIGDRARDAWLQFKSGPFGSVSHSHADQNSFNMFAFGEPLIIDSGYYPWYGSPHDTLWTRQSWAHNLVLVEGHGQPPFDWFARGRIESFADARPFAYARGEAAAAYNRPANGLALELAQKHCPELAARMGPAAEVRRASRSVLMVAGARPYFVVLDWLETATSAAFQWLAHTLEEAEIQADGFVVRRGAARLNVRFIVPTALDITQTSRFPVAPEGRARGSPDQWHITAATTRRSATARFIAVLAPFRDGEKPLEITPIERGAGEKSSDAGGTVAARVGRDVVLAPAAGARGTIGYGTLQAEAALVAITGRKIFAADATSVVFGEKALLQSAEPASVVLRAPHRIG